MYFKESEFVMGSKNVYKEMNPILLHHLEIIRGLLKVPLTITSSYRGKIYNRKVGGSESSQHLLGNAVDIKKDFTGLKLRRMVLYCLNNDLSIGISGKFIHIDCRENSTMWGY